MERNIFLNKLAFLIDEYIDYEVDKMLHSIKFEQPTTTTTSHNENFCNALTNDLTNSSGSNQCTNIAVGPNSKEHKNPELCIYHNKINQEIQDTIDKNAHIQRTTTPDSEEYDSQIPKRSLECLPDNNDDDYYGDKNMVALLSQGLPKGFSQNKDEPKIPVRQDKEGHYVDNEGNIWDIEKNQKIGICDLESKTKKFF